MPTTRSKSDSLYQTVRQDIISLDLEPGAPLRLPTLSERYRIGLTPLRECLNRLTTEKLVVIEHNKGFRVAPLSRADLLDLEQARNAIEGALFVDSIRQGRDTWEAAVVGSYHHLSKTPFPSVLQAPEDLAQWTKRHEAFHRALISGAPSVWMHRFCDQLGDQLGRYHLFIQNGLRDMSVTQPAQASTAAATFSKAMELAPHTALHDAALARDTDAAAELFRAHANLSIQAFEELIQLLPAETPVGTLLRHPTNEASA